MHKFDALFMKDCSVSECYQLELIRAKIREHHIATVHILVVSQAAGCKKRCKK